MVRFIIIAGLFLSMVGCKTSGNATAQEEEFVMATPENTEDQVEIDGRVFTLNAEIWVNFMPPVPENGRPASGALVIQTANGQKFKPNFSATAVWLYNKTDESMSFLTDELEAVKPHTLGGEEVVEARWTFNNGPQWTGDTVDVIVQLTTEDEEKYYVKHAGVKIMRVE